ncbi:MAG: methyltransferase domain-containing protein [Candidatus Magasanikbacteria bacterium]|nr:methyltransferase domain-containing protein [Candidatus Magasanikbacteria bacterium]
MDKRKAQEIVRQMRQIYNTVAKEWDASRGTPTRIKMKVIRPVKKGMRVLDLGCGNGLMAGAIIGRGGRYIGVDISGKFISLCKKKYSSYIKTNEAEFVTADAVKLPFKNNYFDFAVSIAVMHHIPSAELRLKFLQELHRVLKSGAVAKLDNWNLLEDWGRKKFNISRQLANPPAGYDKGDVFVSWKATGKKDYPRFIHIFSDRELRSLARDAGFKKIKIEYYNRAGKKLKNGEAQILTIMK